MLDGSHLTGNGVVAGGRRRVWNAGDNLQPVVAQRDDEGAV